MKDYEVRIERLNVLGSVMGLLECQLNSDEEYLKHYLDRAEEVGCDEFLQSNVEKYTVRVKTMEELIKFINSDDKKLPWNNSNPF